MNPFWGVYFAIAFGAFVWYWRRSELTDKGGMERISESFAFGIGWFPVLIFFGVMNFCEWFDKKFAGRGK